MFSSKFVKKLVRERMTATSEGYTEARRHVVGGLITKAFGRPAEPETVVHAGADETFNGWMLGNFLRERHSTEAFVDEQGTFVVQVVEGARFEILRAPDAATMQRKLQEFAGDRALVEQERNAVRVIAKAAEHLRSRLERSPKTGFKVRPFTYTLDDPLLGTPAVLRGDLADDGKFVVTGCGREVGVRPIRTGLDDGGAFVVFSETCIDLRPKGLTFVVGPDDGRWQEKDAVRLGFEFPTDLDERTSNKPNALALVFFDEDGGVVGGAANWNWLPKVFGW